MYLKERTDIYPDGYEQLFFYTPSPTLSVSMATIVSLIQKKQIRKSDIELISFLYEFTMASVEQLALLFDPEQDEQNMKSTLDKLVKMRILNKFCLAEDEKVYNDNAYIIYCIDKGGAELLKHYQNGEDYNNFRIEKMVLPTLKVWKHLVVVDFYIRLLESCPNKLMMFQVKPTVPLGKQRIVPHFGLCVNHNDEDKFFVGDVVFATDVSVMATRSERFVEKAVQLENLLCTNVYKKCFGYTVPPTLLIITEDEETLARVADIISTTNIGNCTQYRLTTPERLKKNLGEKGVFVAYKDEKLVSLPNNIFVE